MDEFRKKFLDAVKRVVIKIGSSVLTDAHGLDGRVLARFTDQVAILHDKGLDVVIVSSGAVAAGRRALAGIGAISALPDRQAASAIGQSRLMREYDRAFERYGKITAQILLTREDLKSRPRFLNARHTFQTLLSWRVIPIVNENDTVAVQELKFGDNDSLASLILNIVEADLLVNLTSADGVYDSNPAVNPEARRLDVIEDISTLDADNLCQGKTTDGTGGMYSKLLAAKRAAQLGVPTLVISGRERFSLERAFAGEALGTWIMPEKKAVSRRKFWLAYNQDPAGTIIIDAGAARALITGKSLLPAGIIGVEGGFGAGALTRIVDFEGKSLGVGLSNFKASELRNIMGRQSSEIESILGHCLYAEAVHCDNLLLDAAI